jgi:hypothetical protein
MSVVRLGYFRVVYSHLKLVEWPKHVAEEKWNRTTEKICCDEGNPIPLSNAMFRNFKLFYNWSLYYETVSRKQTPDIQPCNHDSNYSSSNP